MGSLVELAGAFVASPATLQAATRNVSAVTDDRPSLEYSELSGLRATRMPSQLFDLSGIADWCTNCRELVPDLDGYLGVLAAIYASDAYLNAGLMSRADGSLASFTLPESAAAQRVFADSAYLQRMLGPKSTGAKRRAKVLLAEGAARQAIGVLSHAIYLSPADAEGYALLGRALTEAGDAAGGIAAHWRAVQLEPRMATRRFELALAKRRAGDLEGALDQFASGIKLAPEDADGRYLYAAALQAGGRNEEADRQLARALDLEPGHPRANLVMCKRAVAAERFEDARRHCDLAARGGVPIAPDLAERLAAPPTP
ncbi:MAG: tetratricopeptide repeat protein [Deltaproteobacteria bacterium]|nr:tetratricopeptide repeat protein [Deltaproteobacteria bacterium]